MVQFSLQGQVLKSKCGSSLHRYMSHCFHISWYIREYLIKCLGT